MLTSTSLRWLVVAVSAAILLAVAAACSTETIEVPGETVVVEKEVIKEVMVPGETIVVEKEVVKTVAGPERVVVKEVVVGGEYVTDPATGKSVQKPRYGGTITVGEGGEAVSWDPWRNSDGGEVWVMGMVYEALFGGDWAAPRSEISFRDLYVPLKYTTGRTAESFENPDPLTYIIHLRKGTHFWDRPPVNGREVTADDVKYSIDRMLGQGEFAEAGPSPHVVFEGWPLDLLKEVEVVDRYTLNFHLNKPAPLFPEVWGTDRSPLIIPREVVDTYGNDFSWEHVVGSGPWMLVEQVTGVGHFYEKNPNYYDRDEKFPENQIPYADKFEMLFIKDFSTRMAAMRTGKIARLQWWRGLEYAQSLWETNPELQSAKIAGSCWGLHLRYDLEPYSDIRVRKAMQKALNLEELASTIFGGVVLDLYPLMINPQIKTYYTPLEELLEDVQEGFRYNPARAEELLDEAGLPRGADGIRFTQELPVQADYPPPDVRDAYVAYLEDIGIKTEIKMMPGSAEFGDYISGRRHQVVMTGDFCAPFAPIGALKLRTYGDKVMWNLNNADDPVLNKMVDNIASNPDAAERDRLMKEANAYIAGQFFSVGGPNVPSWVFWQPWLKGYNGEMDTNSWGKGEMWSRVWIDQELKFHMTGKRD